MQWIIFATSAYFFGALTVIFDKYLLGSQRISSPPVYAFYVALSGMAVLIFWPLSFFSPFFALNFPTLSQFLLSIFSGIFFLFGITALYFAFKKAEASKVAPVAFSSIPLVTFCLSLFFKNEKFSSTVLVGLAAIILGGLLISFDLPLKKGKKKFFVGFELALLSGFLQAISLLTLKLVYLQQNFYNGYVWTRFGAFVGVGLLLLIPAWRKGIVRSMTQAKKAKKKNLQTGFLFVLNKIFGGSSSALINMAIKFGSVTLVSAMISLQYVFVLILAVLASTKIPHIFEERLKFWDWMQKLAAILIIGVGMFLIS